MVLGAIWCPLERVREITEHIREIKERHGLPRHFETKWVKVSPAKLGYYQEVLEYFFAERDLHFRALVVPDKSILRHDEFEQTHDIWYYKMYYVMLKAIFGMAEYRIYLDIKDSRSARKVAKLQEVLQNAFHAIPFVDIQRIQIVRSEEVEILQLADLLIGAISYANRHLDTSPAKSTLVDLIRRRAFSNLTSTTPYSRQKVNIILWQPAEAGA
jgi:hypothetical protein